MKITLNQALEAQEVIEELIKRALDFVGSEADLAGDVIIYINEARGTVTLREARAEEEWSHGETFCQLVWEETEIPIHILFKTKKERDAAKREAAIKAEEEHERYLKQVQEAQTHKAYMDYLTLKAIFEPSNKGDS